MDALGRRGITAPWAHQVEAAEAAHRGRPTVLCTPTASGKSLGYLLPVLAATWGGEPLSPPTTTPTAGSQRFRTLLSRPHTALYLSPTKALAHDQLRACRELGLPSWRVATVDGDSDRAERDWARDHAAYLLTNPDMLHRSILPNHRRWASFLRGLSYVVIDESHLYRGIFGAHVALILRRLRRICADLGADPVFLCSSATSGNPAEAMSRLTGVDEDEVVVVAEDSAPHGQLDFLLWQPADSHDLVTADLMARLVDEQKQVLSFVSSRRMAEVVAARARERVADGSHIEAYRSGYLAYERRDVEAHLQQGLARGVAATSALELGVDVTGMDAVLISGYPGTLASLWQRAGRAGRSLEPALAILVGRADPLDAWLLAHPEMIFSAPVERTIVDPNNRFVVASHLAAAAQELPATEADERWFGWRTLPLLDELTAAGILRKRPNGWFWTHPQRAVDSIDIRSIGGRPVEIIDSETGRVVGHVDASAADRTVHTDAVYLHQGTTWRVDAYAPDDGVALVRAEAPGWTTEAVSVSSVEVVGEQRSRRLGAGRLHFGEVRLTSQVTAYRRRDAVTGEVWDETPLDLPEHSSVVESVWWTLPDAEVTALGFSSARTGAAAHAAEHTAIGLLPAFVPCDRWDVGGLSTAHHADTGTCTVLVHEGVPGGAGFVAAGYDQADAWLGATLERLRTCDCAAGCPRCTVSPKCGNANQMLDKPGAIALLELLLG